MIADLTEDQTNPLIATGLRARARAAGLLRLLSDTRDPEAMKRLVAKPKHANAKGTGVHKDFGRTAEVLGRTGARKLKLKR